MTYRLCVTIGLGDEQRHIMCSYPKGECPCESALSNYSGVRLDGTNKAAPAVRKHRDSGALPLNRGATNAGP